MLFIFGNLLNLYNFQNVEYLTKMEASSAGEQLDYGYNLMFNENVNQREFYDSL